MPAEIAFTEREMDQLYHLSVKCKNNSISQEELITTARWCICRCSRGSRNYYCYNHNGK